MQQGPRVAVIGLDCGTPQLLFHDLQARCRTSRKLMGEGMYGDLASHHPADHGPRLGVRDDRQDAGPARASTASATARTPPTTGCRSRTRASIKEPAVWDELGAQGHAVGADRRPARASRRRRSSRAGASAASSRRRRPSAARIPQELEAEIEEELGGQRTTSSTSRTSASRARLHARPDLQDDRAAVPGRAPAHREQAVGLLHAVRDRAATGCTTSSGSTTTRGTRCTSPATGTRRTSRTTTGSSTASSARCWSWSPTTPSRWS